MNSKYAWPEKFNFATSLPIKASVASTAEIFGGIDSAFKPAVILGQGLPTEKNGQPVQHFWKESLLPKTFLDADGVVHSVDSGRVSAVVSDFKRAAAKGHRPPILDRHVKKGQHIEPAWSRGFLLDARKSESGSVEYLCQFVGEDAIKEAARNQASICIYPDEIDEDGDLYQEFTHHLAVCPDPQLRNLKDFTPALAASQRGATATPVYLMLASSQPMESEMDIAKLREAAGAGKDIPDDGLYEFIKSLKTEKDKAITLSTTATSAKTDLETKLQAAMQRADAADAKVLTLSRTPDPEILADRADLMTGKIDLVLSQGRCNKAQADLLKGMLKEGDKPNALMLSRSGAAGTPVDNFLKVLELNASLTGSHTGVQKLPDPNQPNGGEQAAKAAAEAYMKQRYPGPVQPVAVAK